MIDAFSKRGVGWSSEREVPLKQVALKRCSGIVRRRRLGKLGSFFDLRGDPVNDGTPELATKSITTTYVCAVLLATWS